MKTLSITLLLFILSSCHKEDITFRLLDSQTTWIEDCERKTIFNYTIYRVEKGRTIPTQAETQLKTERIPNCEAKHQFRRAS